MPLVLPQMDLARHHTLASPVKAEAYMAVHSRSELVEALDYAAEHKLPILPLGGGSNIVLAHDFPGLVIGLQMRGYETVCEDDHHAWVRAQAGENWHDFVRATLHQGLAGLENLSLIPGSVGAAPIQNIGAYGVELADVFVELTALEIASRLPVIFTLDACDFGYRDSVFKNRLRDRYIITDVTLKLAKDAPLRLDYPSLAEKLAGRAPESLTPLDVSDAVCSVRREKLPDPQQTPNAGSFFKNPVVGPDRLERLKAQHPDIVAYPLETGDYKLAAGWLIDRAGWRGYREGAVAVHDRQALVLTNPGRAGGQTVLDLADRIAGSVRERYGVALEIEPRVYA